MKKISGLLSIFAAVLLLLAWATSQNFRDGARSLAAKLQSEAPTYKEPLQSKLKKLAALDLKYIRGLSKINSFEETAYRDVEEAIQGLTEKDAIKALQEIEKLNLLSIEQERKALFKEVNNLLVANPHLLPLKNENKFSARFPHLGLDRVALFPSSTEHTLQVTKLEDFPIDKSTGKPTKTFLMPVHNYIYHLKVQTGVTGLAGKITCNDDVSLNLRMKKDPIGKEHIFPIESYLTGGSGAWINMPLKKQGKPDLQCTLRFGKMKEKNFPYGINLVSDRTAKTEFRLGQAYGEICAYDGDAKPENSKSPYHTFLNMHHTYMSCMEGPLGDGEPARKPRLLVDPIDALAQKIGILTGTPPSRKIIEDRDVDTKLDFSKMIKYDLIVMSYLEFKNDFAGNMMKQAIIKQAQAGAMVRIIATGALFRDKDATMMEEMTRASPNIQFQKYTYSQGKVGAMALLNSKHRVNHMKQISVISLAHPEKDVVITGGRNIKDTFVYNEPTTYPKRPDWVQYSSSAKEGHEGFMYYEDLDIMIYSPQVARQAAAQTLAFWYRDAEEMYVRPTSFHVPAFKGMSSEQRKMLDSGALEQESYARHFVSVPFVDGHAMEKIYEELFNSAKKSIRMVSPYLRPMDSLANALEKAVKRGIKVEVITRIKMGGDNYKTAEDINRMAVRKFYKLFDVYEWQPESILHEKTVMIDNKLLYIGGTNFNNRSFLHDIESGFIITGQDVVEQYNKLFDHHLADGRSKLVKELDDSRLAEEKAAWNKFLHGVKNNLLEWAIEDAGLGEMF